MQHVRVTATDVGFDLDPTAYTDLLPTILPQLPPGAAAFADDEQHYRFHADHCVKDLKLAGIDFDETESMSVTLAFTWRFGSPTVLSIAYSGVQAFTIETGEGYPGGGRFWSLGELLLDEILPHPIGCSHEMEFTAGRVHVICGDLTAVWQPSQP